MPNRRITVAVALIALLGIVPEPPVPATTPTATSHVASGWDIVKFPLPQPVCDGVGLRFSPYFDRTDCGFIDFDVSGTTPDSTVAVGFFGVDGAEFDRVTATWRTDIEQWEIALTPDDGWPSGDITLKTFTDGEATPGGEYTFFLNKLGASLTPTPKDDNSPYRPGEDIPVTGSVYQQDSVAAETQRADVAAGYKLRVVDADGTELALLGPFTADDGIDATIPGSATAAVTAGPQTDFRRTIAIEVVDASYADPFTGEWVAARAGAGSVRLRVVPDALVLENSFVSSVGWVKPGDTYPFRVIVKNPTDADAADVQVTVPAVDGTTFTAVAPNAGTATVTGGTISWTIPTLAKASASSTTATLVVEARADTAAQDPQVVWKNLSSTASLAYAGHATPTTATSHGPKVIPPEGNYETARYGDRPFPVVPVDYADFKHGEEHTGERLDEVINSPEFPGSTFNLFQEMSYGQLHPEGTVPSAAIASAAWDPSLYKDGYRFSQLQPQGTCRGATLTGHEGTPLLPERISGGWYQLPGTRDYYGDDGAGTAIAAGDIDDACGPTAKAVYDAARIADPEIDYSDYDTDKDGVVDFFMMVFQGEGGNGVSQTSVPPYDNIWPHSSTLEATYVDEPTGLTGYITDDQLRDNEGNLLYYEDEARLSMTTEDTGLPVFVRVGPYNVNPESAMDFASVISHEYGHSLGLPDFYFNDGVPVVDEHQAYGTWNLMATDYSQHMDIFGRQELGWVVPRVLQPGRTASVEQWKEAKVDTDRIDWVQPDGTPYTLTGDGVDNGEAYVAKLPGRTLVSQEKLDTAVPGNVQAWWSGSGNDFGCPPMAGRNLDIHLPQLADIAAGTPVTLTLKSSWDIEWDYDYGYVLTTTDRGQNYTSHASENGYTTDENPNDNSCQAKYGNGLTGASGSFANGTQDLDRNPATTDYPSSEFLDDEFDLGAVAGHDTVLRFAYSTDVGLARPGWFIDNVVVKAGDTVVYQNDFDTTPDDEGVYNGGCDQDFRVAVRCTPGWQTVSARIPSTADHAYYLELRDRTGFDFDSRGQADRGDLTWAPGLSLAYTDEARGYGNAGYPDPPRQNVLDANPDPESRDPNLDDAAFRFGGVKTFSDSGTGHVDNYADPARPDGLWRFDYDCLTFEITSMTGDDVGPSATPGNLTGDVTITTGTGCAEFDYGHGAVDPANTAPVAVAQARPTTVTAGGFVTLDASGSTDDNQAPDQLQYRWDVDGDGTYDMQGVEVTQRYDTPGTYQATVEVADAEGLADLASVTITVTEPERNRGGPGPTCSGCDGYWLAAEDGGVFAFGDAPFLGSMGGMALNAPVVGMASTPSGDGYWLAAEDGGVFAFGDAGFEGSAVGEPLNAPVVGMAATPSGEGYWLAAEDGGVFAFGDAPFLGSMGGMPLNAPVVGMVATPSGEGYWLVAADGGVFAFGDADFEGSAAGTPLNAAVTGMAATTSGEGYWLVAEDGGVFTFGDAPFHDSVGGKPLNGAVVGLASTPTDGGYWLGGADGGVFTFGDARFRGSAAGKRLNAPVVAVARPFTAP